MGHVTINRRNVPVRSFSSAFELTSLRRKSRIFFPTRDCLRRRRFFFSCLFFSRRRCRKSLSSVPPGTRSLAVARRTLFLFLLVDRSYFFSPAFKIILLIFGGGIESTTVYPFGRGNATTTVYFSSPVVSLFSISAPSGSLISLTVARRSTFSFGYRLFSAGKFEVGRQKLPVIPPEVGRLTSRP